MLILPFVQSKLNFLSFKSLDGAYNTPDNPNLKILNWTNWFNENFQNQFNKSIENHIGFRNFLVRLNNQIDYTFFRRTSTLKAIIGKSDCLYEEGYILDYLGRNFVGKDSINNQLKRIKWLQNYLKREKNIDLILVFEPGKASFYPEFIPDSFHLETKTISNYTFYSQQCKAFNINLLDLNAWFISIKNVSKFPLFPKYGVHWSTYGMCLASDTLIHFIEKTRKIDIPDVFWNDMQITDKLKDVDFDLELTLNLLFPLPHETMAYPNLQFENGSGKIKPKVLVIADSYYWSIFNSKIPVNVFSSHEFWYYNSTIYPNIWGENAQFVDHTKDKENIEKQDIIILMLTELNMNRNFFGFIDKIYNIYHSAN